MPHYRASIDTAQPPEAVFTYLSDFSTTAQWDPGVVEARRLGDAAIGLGSEFQIVAVFLGRRTPLTYRIIEYAPPGAVTLRAETQTVVAVDRMTIENTGNGARVTYDANLALKRPWRIAEPLLALAFRRVGDRALASLRTVLGPPSATLARPVEEAQHAGG